MKAAGTREMKKKISLESRLYHSYIFIILLMVLPTIYAVIVQRIHSAQYDTIITNVSLANNINSIAKNAISNELWSIVSGRKQFTDGEQYRMLMDIKEGIDKLEANTKEEKGREKLIVANRTEVTLHKNITTLGLQINSGATVAKNEEFLDEIRGITALLSDILQEYIIIEIEEAQRTNEAIKTSSIQLSIIQIAIILFVVIFSVKSFLGTLAAVIEEQKNMQKAELKSLQSQITPHFLYNTFDTIIWLAEAEQTDTVVKVTRAFSEFLRISLSRGHEWITVEQEISHISNYLTIQKIRYEAILNYEIDIDKELFKYKMLKLTLQPLVENAIYHGIKNKRGRGHIKVIARYTADENDCEKRMRFSVEDDGAGFSAKRLEDVKKELLEDNSENVSATYGLYNVNKRLILYYNGSNLEIESSEGKGTKVSFTIPCIEAEQKQIENMENTERKNV